MDEHVLKTTCDLKHNEVDRKMEVVEKRLDAHSDKIDKLNKNSTAFEIEIKHLCNNIKSLTTTLWWFIGIVIGGISTFFFTVVQKGVIK